MFAFVFLRFAFLRSYAILQDLTPFDFCYDRAKSLRPGKGHHAFEGTDFVDVAMV